MLNKIEIDSYWYKISKHLIRTNELPINTFENSKIGTLTDQNHRLIGVSNNYLTLKSLAVFNLNVGVGFTTPKMISPPNFLVEKNLCWKLSLNNTLSNWEENLNIHSIEELHKIILNNQKVFCLDILHDRIDTFRKIEANDLSVQQFIYFSKYLESKEIIDKNIQNDELMEYPYTSSFARLNQISLQESAKNCKLKYELQKGLLCETENLRIKYKNLIVQENDITKLKTHLNEFQVEFLKYGDL